MKKFYLFVVASFLTLSATCQTVINMQYASSVIGYSSQYTASSYTAEQALGAPDVYPFCGDNGKAWASAAGDNQREYLILGFASPQPVNTIRIYQNVAPGAIDTVYLRNAVTGTWNQIYVHTAADSGLCPAVTPISDLKILEITFPATTYNVNAIRIAINSPAVAYYNEIDAVGIANFERMAMNWKQYASSVISVSSEYDAISGNPWNSQHALGAPDVPICGDNANAWVSKNADDQREYIVLGYAYPAKVSSIRVFQNIGQGAIDTIYLRNAATGIWNTIYTTTAVTKGCESGVLELELTKTTYNVDAVRLAINSPAVGYWNEIDAVELRCELPPVAKRAIRTGNWSSVATWEGGVVPTATDSVVIGAGHNININAAAVNAGLFVTFGGTLTLNSVNTLTIGPSGGGNRPLSVDGRINISNGTLAVNGKILFNDVSAFNMTGGIIKEDGNNGAASSSVPNGVNLVEFSSAMNSFSFTGGTLQIVDPPQGTSSQCIKSSYNFGDNSILYFGDGVSTTAGNYVNGFGGSLLPAQIGNLTLDAATFSNNRIFKNINPLTVKKRLEVKSGNLVQGAVLTVSQ